MRNEKRQELGDVTMHYDRYPHGLISGSQQPVTWSAGVEPQAGDRHAYCK